MVRFADRLAQQIEPFLQREERLLRVVMRDGHDHFIE